MKGDPEFVLLKPLSWLPAPSFAPLLLGAIVRQPLRPSDDYVPPQPLRHATAPLLDGELTSVALSTTATTSSSADTSIAALAGVQWKGATEATVILQGKRVRFLRLQQLSEHFKSLRNDPAVVARVPGWMSAWNTWPPCLVVGLMIADDADVSVSTSESREVGGNVTLPVASAALAATGVPPPALLGALLGGEGDAMPGDVQVGGSRGKRIVNEFTAIAPGSRICALELMIVTTKLLRRRELELKDHGPKFEPGRLAGDEDESDSADEEPPAVEDFVLESFTEKEYNQMAG